MSYNPKTWTTGETITAAELNAIEQAASAASAAADTANTGLTSKVNSSTYTAGLAGKVDSSSLATVAQTGAYADLTGKPTIPAATTLTPTSTKTAAYTAAVGDLAMMNVAGGATTLTLPTAPADKAQVGYRAIGATTAVPLTVNRGGSDTIGTAGATSATVPLADETVVLQYDAPNTRWLAVTNVRTQTSLDLRYRPQPSGLPAGTTVSGIYDPRRHTYNVHATSLLNWHTALARARTGGTSARIHCVGDSTTKGYGGGDTQTNSYPIRLKTLLTQASGLTAADAGLLLNDNTSSGDSRYTSMPTGWSFSTSAGYTFSVQGLTTAAGPLVITLPGLESLRVWYAKNPGTGSTVVTVNDGTAHAQTINTAATAGVGFVEWTGLTPGSQSVSFAVPTVANVFIIAIETFSPTGKIMILNEGQPGAGSADLVTTTPAYGKQPTLLNVGATKPDLIILDMLINDWNNNIAPAGCQTAMQSFITAAKSATQDLLLVVPVPPQETAHTYTWSQFVAVVYALADANNLPLIDMTARWVDYPTANTKGLRFDNLHPNAMGYADKAQAIANVVVPA
jgi:lysophospholipase L1-like esterase